MNIFTSFLILDQFSFHFTTNIPKYTLNATPPLQPIPYYYPTNTLLIINPLYPQIYMAQASALGGTGP